MFVSLSLWPGAHTGCCDFVPSSPLPLQKLTQAWRRQMPCAPLGNSSYWLDMDHIILRKSITVAAHGNNVVKFNIFCSQNKNDQVVVEERLHLNNWQCHQWVSLIVPIKRPICAPSCPLKQPLSCSTSRDYLHVIEAVNDYRVSVKTLLFLSDQQPESQAGNWEQNRCQRVCVFCSKGCFVETASWIVDSVPHSAPWGPRTGSFSC